MKDIKNYNLLGNNTFQISARCKRFVEFSSKEELEKLRNSLSFGSEELMILGGGSNLLLTRDFQGTVLHPAITGKSIRETEQEVFLTAGCHEQWDDIVAFAVQNDWCGMENLSLIPGEVGASAVQNIGAYGAEAKDVIFSIEAMDLKDGTWHNFSAEDCQYAYRDSIFKHSLRNRFVITHVTYRLQKTFTPNIHYGNIQAVLQQKGIQHPTAKDVRKAVIEIRKAKLPDPEVEGNAGSFFMNPVISEAEFLALEKQYPDIPHYIVGENRVKVPAGWLIEQCGWKGKSLGRAAVHEKQALVLVNKGGATGGEVLRLCQTICRDVKQKFQIEIHPEVNIY